MAERTYPTTVIMVSRAEGSHVPDPEGGGAFKVRIALADRNLNPNIKVGLPSLPFR